MRKGFTRKYEPVRVLSDSQVETIHKRTLEVLSEVGCKFESQPVKTKIALNHQQNKK